MSNITQQTAFPSVMRNKLRSVRWRQAAMSAVRAVAVSTAVLIGAMIVAMSLDWCFTIFSTPVRILLTTTSLSACVITMLFVGVRPIVAAFGWTRAAGNVDREIPQLEERWRTVASFAESRHPPRNATSKAMLQQVTSEAVAMSTLVRPQKIVRAVSLRRPMIAAALCGLALVGFMLLNLDQTSILMRRFWSPLLNISATQLTSVTGDAVVPRGQSIEIVTEMSGLRRSIAVMELTREHALPEEMIVKPADDQPGMLSLTIDVDETFTYRVQAGDGRTEWHTVTAIDFPALSEVRLSVTPPDYVDEPVTEKTLIPGRLRAIHGSQLELAMKPVQDLKSLKLVLTLPVKEDASEVEEVVDVSPQAASVTQVDDAEVQLKTVQKTIELTRGSDGWYHFETQLVEDFTLSPVLLSPHDLTNENPRVCRIEVIEDKAPVARIISPTNETSVSPDETIEIKFEAHDDHGIATAELVVYDTETKEGEEPKILAVRQIPLGDQEMQKHLMGKTQLDLKELGLEEGKSISYAIRVTDNRMLEMDPESARNSLIAETEKQKQTEGSENENNDASSQSGSEQKEQQGEVTGDESALAAADKKDMNGDEATRSENAGVKSRSGNPDKGESNSDDRVPSDAASNADTKNMVAKSDDKDSGDAYKKMIESDQDRDPSAEETPGEAQKNVARNGDAELPNDPGNPDLKSQISNLKSEKDGAKDTEEKGMPTDSAIAAADEKSQREGDPADTDLKSQISNLKSEKDGAKDTEEKGMPQDSAVAAADGNSQREGDTADADLKSQISNLKSEKDGAKDTEEKGMPQDSAVAAADENSQREGDPADADLKSQISNLKSEKDGAKDTEEKGMPQDSAVAAADEKTQSEGDPKEANLNSQDSNSNSNSNSQKNGGSLQSSESPKNEDMKVAKDDPKEPDPNSEIPNSESQTPNKDRNKNDNKNSVANSSPSSEPPSKIRMQGQRSDAGQQKETDRQKLKISARLDALAERNKDQKQLDNPVREKVVQIDKMLEAIEGKLSALYKHQVDDSLRGDGFKELDVQLGDVETFIAELSFDTQETAFEFVGLQMVDIGSSHVTPSRDAVFVAIRKPDSGADVHAEEALHHVVSARELLLALLRKYDSVKQEQELAKKLDDAIKMYTVYVEGTQALLREAQQSFDPLKLQREMAVVEVDQAYLDRLAEVTKMRRDMMSELARILGDDPRLRSRYLELIKRRRASLRSQLGELAARQDQIAQEVTGWMNVSENQRDNYWLQISDLRMDLPQGLAKEAQLTADRIEKQLPLAVNPTQGTAALVVELAKQIALDARRCDFDVREVRKAGGEVTAKKDLVSSANDLVFRIGELAAALDQLNFEDGEVDGVSDYVQLRLVENRALADQADTWAETASVIERKQYSGLAQVDQQQVTIGTELLRMEMLGIEADLAGQFNEENPMPQELTNMTRDLLRIMETITFNQSSASFAFSQDHIEPGAMQLEKALNGFDEAGKLLDKIRRKTIEVLDKEDVPDPNIADLQDPTLDQFLAQLEREPDIEAQLGIPNRPRNIRVLQDSMQWAQNGGGMLGTSGEAAMTRIKQQMKQPLNAASNDDKKPEGAEPREMSEEEKQQLAESKDMQEMLKSQMLQTLKELEKKADDTSQSAERRRQMKEMAEKMAKALEEMKDEQNPEQMWRRMVEADQAKAAMEALAKGENLPDDQWNKLMSTLDDGLGQVGGRTPPEDYRKAIEQYQDRIRKLTGSAGG